VENDEMIRAIEGKWDRNKPNFQPFQRIGSLPNRFTAQTDAVGAKQAAKALRETWKKIAQTVWDKKIEAQAAQDSRRIWNRQIEGFWDITWVIGDHRNVDLRKNLRNWLPPPEHGEKCSMCGERQEISGMGMGSFESRGKMREWWTDLAKSLFKIFSTTVQEMRALPWNGWWQASFRNFSKAVGTSQAMRMIAPPPTSSAARRRYATHFFSPLLPLRREYL
jgi:hypothetical protein